MVATVSDIKLGRKARLYINTAATYASPAWLAVNILQNGTLTQTIQDVAFDSRASKHTKHDQAQITTGYSFNVPATTVMDSNFIKLQRSFLGGLKLDMAIMDNTITTVYARGVRGYFLVHKFDRSEDINGHVNYQVEIKPAYDATYDLIDYTVLPKAITSGSAMIAGASAYWDSTSLIVTSTVGTNTSLGKVITAVADGATTVTVDMSAD